MTPVGSNPMSAFRPIKFSMSVTARVTRGFEGRILLTPGDLEHPGQPTQSLTARA